MFRSMIEKGPAVRALAAAVAIGASGGLGASAAAGGVVVTFSLGALPEQEIELAYVGEFLGASRYVSTIELEGVFLTWDYRVKTDSAGKRHLNGETIVLNETPWLIDFVSRAETILCPPIADGSLAGGIVSVTLSTNEDGGCLLCGAGWEGGDGLSSGQLGRVDGTIWSKSSFACPILLCFTGGQGGTGETWGSSPLPSFAGPSSVQSMAHAVSVAITGGEQVKVAMLLVAQGESDTAMAAGCVGDANSDTVVDGADLALLLSAWGEAGCQEIADVNSDGWVDGGDLALVLAAWGECGEDAPEF